MSSEMSSEAKLGAAPVISCMSYRDPDAAIAWLGRAFGFKEHAVYRDEGGKIVHAELTFGNGMVMLGSSERKSEFAERFMTTPADTGGRGTQSVYVIVDDADAHHARAAAAGAKVVIPLKDESYGGRGYTALDPEGHVWSFGTYNPWTAGAKG